MRKTLIASPFKIGLIRSRWLLLVINCWVFAKLYFGYYALESLWPLKFWKKKLAQGFYFGRSKPGMSLLMI
jgi:hypothetical protein